MRMRGVVLGIRASRLVKTSIRMRGRFRANTAMRSLAKNHTETKDLVLLTTKANHLANPNIRMKDPVSLNTKATNLLKVNIQTKSAAVFPLIQQPKMRS
jgi:hypothetical protein